MKKIIIFFVKALFLPFWHLQRLIPRDKHTFVFGSWHGKKYSDNSKALFEYILENRPEFKVYWITHNKKIFQKLKKEGKPVLMAYSIKGWLISLYASVTFTSYNETDINRYALNGAKQIWLWHGMPLKKIQGDYIKYPYYKKNRNLTEKTKLLIRNIFSPHSNFEKIVTATISSSDFFRPFLQTAFFLKEENVWLTGLPRTDYFYHSKKEKVIDDLREKYADSRILLFMPTCRYFSKKTPYNPFAIPSFNEKMFMDFLNKENIVFLYKPHFFDQNISLSSSDRFIMLNDDSYNELYVLVSNIDILITDYSSIYFDFLCLQKPAILVPFDYDIYISETREHYFDYNILPGIKAYSWDELMNIIAEKRYYALSPEEAEKYGKYNDGHASERCLQKAIELLEI